MRSNKPSSFTDNSKEDRLIHAMQLLGDKTRYKIFKLLQSDNEMCVTEIANEVGISVSAVSQHFRNFEYLGLVNKVRYGQKICYELNKNDKLVNNLSTFTKDS